MIDHIGISVASIARATEFYLKALAPLGYGIVMEVSAEETGHGAAIAFGAPCKGGCGGLQPSRIDSAAYSDFPYPAVTPRSMKWEAIDGFR
jgi:hypothetical protein